MPDHLLSSKARRYHTPLIAHLHIGSHRQLWGPSFLREQLRELSHDLLLPGLVVSGRRPRRLLAHNLHQAISDPAEASGAIQRLLLSTSSPLLLDGRFGYLLFLPTVVEILFVTSEELGEDLIVILPVG